MVRISHEPSGLWRCISAEFDDTNKHVTLQLLWEEYREKSPDGYRYSRFCDLYWRWLRGQEVVLRHERRAGEKLFVDYAGDTIPVHSAATGNATAAAIFVAVLGASNYTFPRRLRRRAWPIGSAPACAPSSLWAACPRSLSRTI